MKSVNRENIAEHLIDYKLEMIGKSIQEAYMTKEWYNKWTMTQEQHDVFKAYALPLIKKVFKCNKSRAENTFSWFDLQFGVRIKN
jgi:hypothetical protein